MWRVAGARLTVKLLSAYWDWTCPSTCSMDAGWEISSARHAWRITVGRRVSRRRDIRQVAGHPAAGCHGNRHRALDRAAPVGVYSAIRQDTAADYLGRSIAIIGLATPNFWLAIMVMLYPSIWWNWSPSMQLIPFSEDPLGNLGMFLIPSLILGTATAASTMRLTRTMMLEVLRQDYIRTAWAKGLKERSSFWDTPSRMPSSR